MNTINNKKILLCTFTENVNCVAFTEFQILWALYIVVIQGHHLIENGPVGQRVLVLGKRWKKQEVDKYKKLAYAYKRTKFMEIGVFLFCPSQLNKWVKHL